jgi:pyrroline-5-carboxylate reductase
MGAACQDGDSQVVEDLLKTVGYAVEVPEIYIDPITGLSGSGPSYVSYGILFIAIFAIVLVCFLSGV